MTKNKATLLSMLGLYLFYAYAENQYFGWNRHPESDAEMIADAIGYLMAMIVLLGILMKGEE